jgi:BirA family biotin operon repressor/biotin-[acetyl-CoA-carboxylase] ligase
LNRPVGLPAKRRDRFRKHSHPVTMRDMNSTLSRQRIAALCGPIAQQLAIEVVAETGSTNADLLARVDSLPGPTLLVAETQTAGRGRAGRMWHSAPGASLTFSLAWNFRQPLHALVGLPLAVGVVIAEVLARFGVEGKLKWPNDVLRDGNKLCGILIETASGKGMAADQVWAVIGIGLNMAIPESLAAKIGAPAADVSQPDLEREVVLAALLRDLAQALALFESDSFKPFMARWNALHAYAGKSVAILERDRILHEGIAVGVDQIGRLVLDTHAGRIAIMAGDVSLRTTEN